MLFMFYPSECTPAISKFCPKYTPLGKTTRPQYQNNDNAQWRKSRHACFKYHPPCRHTWAEVAPAIWSSCSNSATRAEADRCSADCLNSHVKLLWANSKPTVCSAWCHATIFQNGMVGQKQHNHLISSKPT